MKISLAILLVVAQSAFLSTSTESCSDDLVGAYENLLAKTNELNRLENSIQLIQTKIDHLDQDLAQTNEALHAFTLEKQTLQSLLHTSELEQVAIKEEYETNQGLFVQVMELIEEKEEDWQEANQSGIEALVQVKTILTTTHTVNMGTMDDNQTSLQLLIDGKTSRIKTLEDERQSDENASGAAAATMRDLTASQTLAYSDLDEASSSLDDVKSRCITA